jgi:hypothetical protein
MRAEQCQWSPDRGWDPAPSCGELGSSAQVAFVFGSAKLVSRPECADALRRAYPKAHIFGCSTAGEIQSTHVKDDTVAVTALAFEHTRVLAAQVRIENPDRSFEAGQELARKLDAAGLRHVLVLSEGLRVNPSDLVSGLTSVLPSGISTSGGFAGDGNRLQNTHVWCDGDPEQSAAVALGFYGDRLRVGVSATGGWKPFGPNRLITKSKKNIVFEFDYHPALALYKQYLGKHAENLPASGLMFPLELQVNNQKVVRAILAVNEAEQSIMFAGNVPEGAYARFMRGRIEDLIDDTITAARASVEGLKSFRPQFSLLVSCNGRRMFLKQRIEEEIEAVREALGEQTILTGFYSYGEIAPTQAGACAELHNETMTITSFAED